jgi:hypothetical protein
MLGLISKAAWIALQKVLDAMEGLVKETKYIPFLVFYCQHPSSRWVGIPSIGSLVLMFDG